MNRLFLLLLKGAASIAVLGGIVVAGLFLYEFVRGPRMRVQVHLTPWEAVMPAPPAGVVPVDPRPAPGAENLTGGLPETGESLARSRTYYEYYCLFCHGEDGGGNGPVGGSYMPRPADLRQAKFQEYSETRLVQAMLTGTGHGPVLGRVVPPPHRPYLVLYIRRGLAPQVPVPGR